MFWMIGGVSVRGELFSRSGFHGSCPARYVARAASFIGEVIFVIVITVVVDVVTCFSFCCCHPDWKEPEQRCRDVSSVPYAPRN